MADKALYQAPLGDVFEGSEMLGPLEGGYMEVPDGLGGVFLSPVSAEPTLEEQLALAPHDANLAEFLPETKLALLGSELKTAFDDDLISRAPWEEAYTKGLELLGTSVEERTTPFKGASAVTHPLIAESAIQFQAQSHKELMPPEGPVKTKVVGEETGETLQRAQRVREFMNLQITDTMESYESDMDQLLFMLPLAGSAFKKVYYNSDSEQAAADFIKAEDLVVPYTASDIRTTPRVTHVLEVTHNYVARMQASGAFIDVELGTPAFESLGIIKDKVDELTGLTPSTLDVPRSLLEMHVELDIECEPDSDESTPKYRRIKRPYIVTLDRDSSTILSLQRNYAEGDMHFKKRNFFVHYKFFPGLGFYGFGLLHMIGGLGRAVTGILRQLIDSGTFANLPAGFKAQGIRVKDSDIPLRPGEFRDISAPGGDLRNALVPLPYKEPSGTLVQLLGSLVTDARRLVSVADEQFDNMNKDMPVGTTIAILERGMRVVSSIHKRMHRAQRQEFKMLARVFRENLPQIYPFAVAGAEREIMAEDFSDALVSVIPVSDPNIFTMTQRVTLAQNLLQLAQAAPEIHDQREAYYRMYQAMEVKDIEKLLPPTPEPVPTDPAIENGALLMGGPAQAFPDQDQKAHIESHILLLRFDIVKATPSVVGAVMGHVFEHASLWAREIAQEKIQKLHQQMGAQMGAQMGTAIAQGQMPMEAVPQALQQMQQSPPPGNPVQMEVVVATLLAEIMSQLTDTMLNLLQGAGDEDPLVQLRKIELELKGREIDERKTRDQRRDDITLRRDLARARADAARIKSQEGMAANRDHIAKQRLALSAATAKANNNG